MLGNKMKGKWVVNRFPLPEGDMLAGCDDQHRQALAGTGWGS